MCRTVDPRVGFWIRPSWLRQSLRTFGGMCFRDLALELNNDRDPIIAGIHVPLVFYVKNATVTLPSLTNGSTSDHRIIK